MPEVRDQKNHPRYQRVASLFGDDYGLIPLETWLPKIMLAEPRRFAKIADFINSLLPPELGKTKFLNIVEGPILFESAGGVSLPLADLSDSYRTYIAWMGDLIYHLVKCCPEGLDYHEMAGVVLVDEIDLHLHPKWQQHILKQIGENLPKMQFVVTSHSPLVASTLPAANIFVMEQDEQGRPSVVHPTREIRGLDADQVLLSPVFGLRNTRTPDFDSPTSFIDWRPQVIRNLHRERVIPIIIETGEQIPNAEQRG